MVMCMTPKDIRIIDDLNKSLSSMDLPHLDFVLPMLAIAHLSFYLKKEKQPLIAIM